MKIRWPAWLGGRAKIEELTEPVTYPVTEVAVRNAVENAYQLGYANGRNDGIAIARQAALNTLKETTWQKHKKSTQPSANPQFVQNQTQPLRNEPVSNVPTT